MAIERHPGPRNRFRFLIPLIPPVSGLAVCALSRSFPSGFVLRDLGVFEAIAIVLAVRITLPPAHVENFVISSVDPDGLADEREDTLAPVLHIVRPRETGRSAVARVPRLLRFVRVRHAEKRAV